MEKRHLTGSEVNDGYLPALAEHNKPGFEQRLQNAQILVARLERLSADSYWAHQASGLRGSLLRCLEQAGNTQSEDDNLNIDGLDDRLNQLVELGFVILVRAAHDMGAH